MPDRDIQRRAAEKNGRGLGVALTRCCEGSGIRVVCLSDLDAFPIVARLRRQVTSKDLTRWVGTLAEGLKDVCVLEVSLTLPFDLAVATREKPL